MAFRASRRTRWPRSSCGSHGVEDVLGDVQQLHGEERHREGAAQEGDPELLGARARVHGVDELEGGAPARAELQLEEDRLEALELVDARLHARRAHAARCAARPEQAEHEAVEEDEEARHRQRDARDGDEVEGHVAARLEEALHPDALELEAGAKDRQRVLRRRRPREAQLRDNGDRLEMRDDNRGGRDALRGDTVVLMHAVRVEGEGAEEDDDHPDRGREREPEAAARRALVGGVDLDDVTVAKGVARRRQEA